MPILATISPSLRSGERPVGREMVKEANHQIDHIPTRSIPNATDGKTVTRVVDVPRDEAAVGIDKAVPGGAAVAGRGTPPEAGRADVVEVAIVDAVAARQT